MSAKEEKDTGEAMNLLLTTSSDANDSTYESAEPVEANPPSGPRVEQTRGVAGETASAKSGGRSSAAKESKE